MKILSVSLKNIHSLAGGHVIDFTKPPLSDTGIFAIVGPTGSGKSTILDAITLALFDNISRFGTSKLSSAFLEEAGGVVTRGHNTAYAEVTYELDGKVYRSRWEFSKRNKNMFLYEGDGDDRVIAAGVKDVIAKNRELIGLNYDQFIRAVILPQGQFAAFLKADSDKRIEILEKITGTEIYRSISQRVYEKTKEKKEQADRIRDRLENIGLLSDNDIAGKNEEILQLEERIAYLDLQKQQLDSLLEIKKQIKSLTEKREAKEQEYQRIIRQIEDFKPSLGKLELHKKALPFSGKLAELKHLTAQKNDIENKIQELNGQKQAVTSHIQTLKDREQKISQDLDSARQYLEKALPVLATVNDLEAGLSTQKALLEEINRTLDGLSTRRKKLKAETENILSQIETHKTTAGKLNDWIGQNRILEQLQLILPEIVSNLDLYDSKRKDLRNFVSGNLPGLADKLSFYKFDSDLETLRQYLDSLEQDINRFNREKSVQGNIDEINHEIRKLNTALKSLAQVKTLVNDISRLKEQEGKLRDELESLTKKFEQIRSLTEQGQKLVLAREKQLHIVQNRLELEKIKQSSAYIRQKLEDGQTCPVCGNKFERHKAPQITVDTLETLELELEQAKKDLEQAREQLLEATKEYEKLKTRLDEKQEYLQKISEETATKSQAALSILQEHDLELDTLEPDAVLGAEQSISTRIDALNRDMVLIRKIEELERSRDIAEQIIPKLQELKDLKQKITDLIEPYKPFLAKANTSAKIKEALQRQLDKWNEANARIVDLEKKLSRLEETKNQLVSQLSTLEEQIAENNRKKDSFLQKYKSLAERRAAELQKIGLDADADVAAFEKNLRGRVEDFQKQLEDLQKQLAGLSAQVTSINDQIGTLERNHGETVNEINVLYRTLLEQLQPAGFEIPEQASRAILPDDEAKSIEQRARELEDLRKATEKELELISSSIEKYREQDSGQWTTVQLAEKIKQLAGHVREMNQQIGSIRNALATDNRNRQLYAQIEQEWRAAQQEYERWYALNELIGSATGDKFQRIAQEYNFMQLVAEANYHLQKLVPRYTMDYERHTVRGKDVFDLYVIDNDMAGERRSVRTLSGGETFLVSLSLALALSSMASYRIHIENLFIDEGFGSLDSQTLDMVLATLEKLQAGSNRQIGIISHVEELKDRIPVKIRLEKLSGGISRIFIGE